MAERLANQPPQKRKDGTYSVCPICPLKGDTGYIPSNSPKCTATGITHCNRLLAERTFPREQIGGIGSLPGHEDQIVWRLKSQDTKKRGD